MRSSTPWPCGWPSETAVAGKRWGDRTRDLSTSGEATEATPKSSICQSRAALSQVTNEDGDGAARPVRLSRGAANQSVRAQRDRGVYARRAPRRNPARDERHRREQRCDAEERDRV